ncbi:MAG: uL15m family ribosomal protein [Candidatus Woesearchaeota archaeon]
MNKRKKNTRQRGKTTHGWGAMKKHRGSGNRGGVGNAGSGKRGDSKKPSFWKDTKYFGMHGFTSKSTKPKIIAINVSELAKYSKASNSTELKMSDFGINKLLGSGIVTKPYNVTVDYASAKAVKKIEDAKGSVTLLSSASSEKKDDSDKK